MKFVTFSWVKTVIKRKTVVKSEKKLTFILPAELKNIMGFREKLHVKIVIYTYSSPT